MNHHAIPRVRRARSTFASTLRHPTAERVVIGALSLAAALTTVIATR